ncbi:MAG: hypothetical protein K2Q22_09240 [Cytophagales bacterium]|nr:hypothetical protein [Cytophagales bacterium]
MKSLVSILLASLFFAGSLFPKSDMDELFKIPALLEHYAEHKAKSSNEFSFMDFLMLHYSLGSTHDESAHANLPLSMDLCTGMICTISGFMDFSFSCLNFISRPLNSFYSLQYSFQSVFSLLNPPK